MLDVASRFAPLLHACLLQCSCQRMHVSVAPAASLLVHKFQGNIPVPPTPSCLSPQVGQVDYSEDKALMALYMAMSKQQVRTEHLAVAGVCGTGHTA